MKGFSNLAFLSTVMWLAILNSAQCQRCIRQITPFGVRFTACLFGILELERQVPTLTLDDVREGPVSITDIHVTNFDIGTRGCDVANVGSRYTVTYSGISLEIEANWSRRRLFRTRRGTLEVSASDSSLAFTFDLGTDSNGCLTISNFGHCEFVLNNFDVDIRGRLLGVIPRRRLPGRISFTIRQQACEQVENLLSEVF